MNYLAHLYLADEDPESIVGNLLGDFLRGTRPEAFSPAVQAGIRRHFRVDAFTDDHPTPRLSRSRIGPERRRYGGVLVDIFYDHFLARHWSEFHPEPLDRFTARCYRALQEYEAHLPERLRLALPHMVEHDWLGSYRDVEGIARTLTRLSRRVRRENPLNLAEGAQDLVRRYDAFEADFRAFFPELVREIRPASEGRSPVV